MNEKITQQKITNILTEIIDNSFKYKLNEDISIIYEEVCLFLELADPDFAYEYEKISPNEWIFQDKYGNRIGVSYNDSHKYFESYYYMKDNKGNDVKIFDYELNKPNIERTSFQGGSDQHRSDTICKILRDEIIPKYLINKKPSIIKLHSLNDYRYKIFMKCAELCKEEYPQINIKEVGKEIYLINK